MKRGTFTKHGSSRTTFSGAVEREDAQPNESLVRKRTTGPPALKPAAPPPVRTFQGRWSQFGNRGRPWGRPANQWNHMPLQTTTEFNSAGPSRNRYPHPNPSGYMASSSTPGSSISAPSRGQTRPHEDHPQGSQFPPRHNKRRKTGHESTDTTGRDLPPHLQDNRCQYGKPLNVPPLPHRKSDYPPHASPPSQPLPTPSASTSPSSPYLPTQTALHSNLPVPPLPSRASKRLATSSPAVIQPPHVPSAQQPSAILSTPAFQQPPQFKASTVPYRVPLPTSILPALRQLGIIPVPWMSLPPPDQPQPVAVLWHEKPDGKWVTLEINMSLVPPSQAAHLANLLSTVTTPRLLTLPSRPAPLRVPMTQMRPTSRYTAPQTRLPHIPVLPAQQFRMRPLIPPTQAEPPISPVASASRWKEPPHPLPPLPPPSSPTAIRTRRVSEPPQPPLTNSLDSPTTAKQRPNDEPPSLSSQKESPATPHKIKTESPSTPSLFCSTPLPPSSSYRPGEMVPEPRRLVRQACTRYMLPEDCHSDYNPQGYQNARRAYFKQKRQELKSKGLDVEKKVVLREDGLVLEWTSPVPVWTDTFLPEAGTDLVSALNETSMGNARIAARSLQRGGSNSRSTSVSASRLTSTPAPVIVIDQSPRPSPAPAGFAPLPPAPEPEHVEEPEPEPASSRRILRPSQVIPPNAHHPKRVFKPVHVPRTGGPGTTDEHDGSAGNAKETTDDGERKDSDSSKKPTMDARMTPLAVLLEPAQPTPVPSPAPAPVPAVATNSGTYEDGGLEYVDESNTEDLPAQAGPGDVAMEPPLSPVASGYGSSASMERVMESLTDPSQLRSREGSPKMQAIFVKEEEPYAMDLNAQDNQLDSTPSTSGLAVQAEGEAVDDEDESEGSIFEGDDILELTQQFLLRYIDTFDHDRSLLEEAYSPDATFSISIHEDSKVEEAPNATTFCTQERLPQRRSSTANIAPKAVSPKTLVCRGREDIINRLCSLGPHKFLSPRLPHAHPSPVYDIVAHPMLPSSTDNFAELVLASLHSEAVNTTRIRRSVVMDHIVTVDQNFVLKLRGDHVPEQGGMGGQQDEEQWPLAIVSHQMVVRDGPMLRQDEVEEVLPWVTQIRAASAKD